MPGECGKALALATMLTLRRVLFVFAATCWLSPTGESHRGFVPSPAAATATEVAVAVASLPKVESREEPSSLSAAVSRKYAALLDQLPPLTASRLRTLLGTETSDLAELATREREISLLLSSDEYSLYERLRESADIQAHLQRFTEQVQSTCPLHPEQQRALLLAKLNHSATAQLLALDPAAEQTNLPAMERAYARDVALQGVDHHQRAFLAEMRPVLTSPQWLALAEFERATVNQLFDPPGEPPDVQYSH